MSQLHRRNFGNFAAVGKKEAHSCWMHRPFLLKLHLIGLVKVVIRWGFPNFLLGCYFNCHNFYRTRGVEKQISFSMTGWWYRHDLSIGPKAACDAPSAADRDGCVWRVYGNHRPSFGVHLFLYILFLHGFNKINKKSHSQLESAWCPPQQWSSTWELRDGFRIKSETSPWFLVTSASDLTLKLT